ncbi:diguanylate cyclase domain-containing protein [Actinomarinicola tropica]|uniref:Diguanylate cyclase n=1 Tax=Actinomarinicola tropica TaxID=2789776 RepID=A0A5Q2RMF8_9ACTN|nr:diguanylate cyclase [Actinomarinicola tropica]QGG95050.1 diguanylate cyclase [Actinomarinicola tropica]
MDAEEQERAPSAPDVDATVLLDALPDPVVVIGTDATLRWANAAAEAAFGWRRVEWLGRDLSELVHPDDLSTALLALESVQGKPIGELMEIRVADATGTYRRVELRGRAAVQLPGTGGVVLSVRDVTDRRRWELAAGDHTALAAVLDALPTIALVLTPDGRIRSTNRAFTRMLGHPLDDVVGRPLTDFVTIASTLVLSDQLLVVADGSGRVSFEVEMLAADGSTRPTSLTIVDLVDDGAVDGLVATATDITELVDARERLRHAATHDDLTGLPNRPSIAQHLRAALADAEADGGTVGVVLVDVDRFKAINDRHGHMVGDAVLVEIAARLHDAARDAGLVGRLGSDEFVVVCPGATADGVERVIDMLHWAMRTPIEVAVDRAGVSVQIRVGVSAGSVLGAPGEDPDELLARVDASMYRSKLRRRAKR